MSRKPGIDLEIYIIIIQNKVWTFYLTGNIGSIIVFISFSRYVDYVRKNVTCCVQLDYCRRPSAQDCLRLLVQSDVGKESLYS